MYYKREEIDFLLKKKKEKSVYSIFNKFNIKFPNRKRTIAQIKSFYRNHNIKLQDTRKCMQYTEEEIKFLINNKNIKHTRKIYEKFNIFFPDNKRTFEQIRSFYKNRRIHKDYIRVAWNKGIKGIRLNPKNEFKKNKNLIVYLDKDKNNKKIENRLEVSLKDIAVVNHTYKTFKGQPELNKAIYQTVKLKRILNSKINGAKTCKK